LKERLHKPPVFRTVTELSTLYYGPFLDSHGHSTGTLSMFPVWSIYGKMCTLQEVSFVVQLSSANRRSVSLGCHFGTGEN